MRDKCISNGIITMDDHVTLTHGSESEHDEQSFTDRQMADVERIKSILDPVFPLTLNEWLFEFMRSDNPDGELAWWIGFTATYSDYTKGMSLDQCKIAFEQLIQFTNKNTLVLAMRNRGE